MSLCNKCSQGKLVPKDQSVTGQLGVGSSPTGRLQQLWAESSYLEGSSILGMFCRDFLMRVKQLLHQAVMRLKICVFVMVLV